MPIMRHYDPEKHCRRSIRLRELDYACAGAYFLTIVTFARECLFDDSLLRRAVEMSWCDIPRHFAQVTLDEWVIMPNHLHSIIVIGGDPRRGEAFPDARSLTRQSAFAKRNLQPAHSRGDASPLQPPRGVTHGSLGAIIGNFKSVTARRINQIRDTPGATIWQRNYYEHIVRDEDDLNRIRSYIAENPERWEYDRENPHHHSASDDWSLEEDRSFGRVTNAMPTLVH